jgi:hypothetical protein
MLNAKSTLSFSGRGRISGLPHRKFRKFRLLPWWETVRPERKFKRKVPLTVCIAAICGKNSIFGACDRMLTSGDIEFEPALDAISKPIISYPGSMGFNTNAKIFPLTNSIVALTAGDSGLQEEILQSVCAVIQSKLQEPPPRWYTVREAVDVYLWCYDLAKAKRAQSAIYAPLGLDKKTFIERQGQMSDGFVSEITKQLQRFDSIFADSYGVETILTGIDEDGGLRRPHIYSVIKSTRGDVVTCCDSVGFAAIGSGARHAESQFMMAGHTPFSELPETLFLTYLAKKRSEVAPGVGEGTDMFAIGPQPGSFAMLGNIPDFDMKKLESLHKLVEKGQANIFKKAKSETKAYIDNMFKVRASQLQQQQNPNPPTELEPPTSPAKQPI